MIRAAWVFMVVQVDLGLVWFRFAPDNAPGFTYANRRARRVDWEILDFFWIEIRGNFSSAGAWVDSHATFPSAAPRCCLRGSARAEVTQPPRPLPLQSEALLIRRS